MKKSTLLLMLFFGMVWSVLTASYNDNGTTSGSVQRIDMAVIPEGKFEQLVEEITCFPLRNKRDSILDVTKLLAYKDYFYLMCYDSSSVQIYKQDGDLIQRLRLCREKDPSIVFPTDMLINQSNEQLWVNHQGTRVKVFTLRGEAIEQVELNHRASKIELINDNLLLVYSDISIRKKDKYLFYVFPTSWDAEINRAQAVRGKLQGNNTLARLIREDPAGHDLSRQLITSDLLTERGQMFKKSSPIIDAEAGFIEKDSLMGEWFSFKRGALAKDPTSKEVYAIDGFKNVIYTYKDGLLVPFLELDFKGAMLTNGNYSGKVLEQEQIDQIKTLPSYVSKLNSFHALQNFIFFHTEGNDEAFYLINPQRSIGNMKAKTLFEGYIPKNPNPIPGSDANCLYLVEKTSDLKTHYKGKKSKYDCINKLLASSPNNQQVVLCLRLKP
ncbi:MAG: hypothetical protein ACRDCN_08205 [Tannerellaceae bacterium]